MRISDLRKIAARGEDSRLQFKADVSNVDALAAEMAAFANCEGGRILIGVGDNGG
jgi:ATP-dependent DNA helicase RecG